MVTISQPADVISTGSAIGGGAEKSFKIKERGPMTVLLAPLSALKACKAPAQYDTAFKVINKTKASPSQS
jgi:hypothetical protein